MPSPKSGSLAPCPSTPNCVVSMYEEDKKHHLKPWSYRGGRDEVRSALLHFLQNQRNVSLQSHTETYIHACFRIPFFGYTDDVEFYLPPDKPLVHFRSASRKGHWDLGVNRRRLKWLLKKLQARGLDLTQ